MTGQTVVLPVSEDKPKGFSLAHPCLSTRVGRGSIVLSTQYLPRDWPNRCVELGSSERPAATMLLTRAQTLNVIGVLEGAARERLIGRVGSIWGLRGQVLLCTGSLEPVYHVDLEIDKRWVARLEEPGISYFIDQLKGAIGAL